MRIGHGERGGPKDHVIVTHTLQSVTVVTYEW
jgi:hypothetical protein